MTSLETLLAEAPPPAKPFAAKGDWNRVEANLGLVLPADYKTFISTYGSGRICDFVWVFSPFVHNRAYSLIPNVSETTLAYKSYVDSGVMSSLPYAVYPENGGLLPFGTTQNNNCINWLTKGDHAEWELVVWDPLEFIRTGYRSLTAYLADLVQQRCGLCPGHPPSEWFDPPRSFTSIDYDSPEWPVPGRPVTGS